MTDHYGIRTLHINGADVYTAKLAFNDDAELHLFTAGVMYSEKRNKKGKRQLVVQFTTMDYVAFNEFYRKLRSAQQAYEMAKYLRRFPEMEGKALAFAEVTPEFLYKNEMDTFDPLPF